MMSLKKFLHVGCGMKTKKQTTAGFNTDEWQELRFDIDEQVNPDFTGTMTDMREVSDSSVDALYSAHNIEHLYPHEVPVALKEFHRVLNDEGFLVITCPDLQSVCAMVAEDKLLDTAYESQIGPITPLDIIYGLRISLQNGHHYMAHKCGFTQKVLIAEIVKAGFGTVASIQRTRPHFDLFALATKHEKPKEQVQILIDQHFPK